MSARFQDRLPAPVAAAGVFALALLVRLVHLWQIRRATFFDLMLGDAASYDAWARRIAAGDWLGSGVFYQAPLYPYFLGTVHALFGDGKGTVLVCQAVIGAGSSALLAAATRRFLAPRRDAAAAGVAAGLTLALYGPAVFFDGLIQKSVLDLFFLCLVLWLVARIVDRPGPPGAGGWWLGAALGALVLSRENALVFAAVLLPWILLRRGRRRRVPAALFLLGLGAVLLPVALRNLAVGGELHLTTSQLGPNFYIGNHRGASGVYEPLRPGRGSFEYERLDATAIAERAAGRELGAQEVSRYWTRRTGDDIAADPVGWLRLLGRKLRLAVNAVEIVDTEGQYTYADHSAVLRLAGAVLHFGTLAPLALLGAWVTWEERRRLGILYALAAGYLASLLLFYVVARYRYPLVPLLVPFAAAGAVGLPDFLRRRRTPRRAAAALAVVAVAVFCNWPAMTKSRMRAVTELNIGQAYESRGELDAAARHFRRAVELDRSNAMAAYNLGTVLMRPPGGRGGDPLRPLGGRGGDLQGRGDLEAAVGELRRALEIRPDYARARVNLGVALASRGEVEAAIGHFEQALELEPDDLEAHTNLALALQSRGEVEAAAGHLRRALELDPDHLPAHESLGNVLVAAGRLRQGIVHYREVLRLDPDRPGVHGQLGLVHRSLGDLEAAVRHLRRAALLTPDDALAHNRLGNALLAAGDVDGAIVHYRRVVELEPRNFYGHANLGMALRRAGRSEEAEEYLRQARRLR